VVTLERVLKAGGDGGLNRTGDDGGVTLRTGDETGEILGVTCRGGDRPIDAGADEGTVSRSEERTLFLVGPAMIARVGIGRRKRRFRARTRPPGVLTIYLRKG